MSAMRCTLKRSFLAAAISALLASPALAFTERTDTKEGRNFDARPLASAPTNSRSAIGEQAAAIDRLRQQTLDLAVDIDPVTGATRSLSSRVGYLTAPSPGGDVKNTAMAFVRGNAGLLGLSDADLAEFEVTDDVLSRASGIRHLYLRQMYRGLPVYNGQLHINVDRDGSILSINNQFIPDLAGAVNRAQPALAAQEAVVAAALHLHRVVGSISETGRTASSRQITTFNAPLLSEKPINASLMLLPTGEGEVRLVWNFPLWLPDGSDIAEFNVDAETGKVWTRISWVSDAQYRAYGVPVESPLHSSPPTPADGRVTLLDPHHVTASPFAWHDTNGVAGAEFTVTQGNNVHAYTDTDNNNTPDPGSSPDCGASLNCVFALDLTLAPSTYRPAAVANLFYMNNMMHDVSYPFGFDEAGGNFQVNNYGRGGLGNDSVNAEAQDGAGTNNANFGTPPDGQAPRMQMFLWTSTTPNRDGDFDNGIIAHEYGHGISNRLVGGPSNVSCLTGNQRAGEGLSDWWALYFTQPNNTDSAARIRGIGNYALGQAIDGVGIRALRYDGNPVPNTNTWTYASINGAAVPHGVGSRWAQAYWLATWALIDEHGYDPQIDNFSGTASDAGNIRAMYYSIEGLKNTTCNPAFTDIRDGIIQAAAAANPYNGEDVCLLWESFASFGLGEDAVSGGSNSTSPTDGFNVPLSCKFLGSTTPVQNICAGANAQYPITVGAALTAPVTLSTSGTPGGSIANFSPNPVVTLPGASTLTLGNTAGLAAGSYDFTVNATGADPLPLSLQVATAVPGAPSLSSPANAAIDISTSPTLSWAAAAQAESYTLEIATDAGFSNVIYTQLVEGTSHVVATPLQGSTQHHWRVRPSNACGAGGWSSAFTFTTLDLHCTTPNQAIPDNTPAGISSSIVVANSGVIDDLDVVFQADHTWVGDLIVTLTKVGSGTTVALIDRPGVPTTTFGCSGDNPDLVLDDEEPTRTAENNCQNANPAYIPGATYRPNQPLSAFDGIDMAGTWTLTVSDNAAGDNGSLVSWCLAPSRAPVEIFKDGFEQP
ncbi:M36 family metallopeptidase [Xanthomonadaceae bacterium JHOS43]|nr:M36 family metallopeptidase [Xanthomonadaceae bacterium JHOS43]